MISQRIKEYLLKLSNEEGIINKAQLAERTYVYISDLIANSEKDKDLRRVPLYILINKLSKLEKEIEVIMNEMFERKLIGGFKKIKLNKKDNSLTKKDVYIKGTTIFKYNCMIIEIED